MTKITLYACAGLAVLCLLMALVIRILYGELVLERSEHARTGQQLVEAVKEGNRWAVADAQRQLGEKALQQQVQSGQARERQTQLDAVEREERRKKATYTAPTAEQKARMIDAETRQRIVDKLNCPL